MGFAQVLCLAEILFTARTGLPSQMEITSWMPRVPCSVEIQSAMTVGEQGSSLVPLDGEIGFLWIDSSPRAASFRQRAGHIGGEVHRLAEWRRPLRTPAVARIVFRADPWPTKGASEMRDSTPGKTLRAGTRKLR